jgi:hypothetical protein
MGLHQRKDHFNIILEYSVVLCSNLDNVTYCIGCTRTGKNRTVHKVRVHLTEAVEENNNRKNFQESGYYTYHLLQETKLRFLPAQCICVSPVRYGLHTVYLCVPYGSHSKQRLFPHTALTGWAL